MRIVRAILAGFAVCGGCGRQMKTGEAAHLCSRSVPRMSAGERASDERFQYLLRCAGCAEPLTAALSELAARVAREPDRASELEAPALRAEAAEDALPLAMEAYVAALTPPPSPDPPPLAA